MKTQLYAALGLGAEPVAHQVRPNLARRPILGDLLEKVIVRVEKEAQPWREFVDVEASLERPLHVLHAVPQREGQLLHGGGSRFPNMITADGNWIVARGVSGPEFDSIGHQPHGGSRRI